MATKIAIIAATLHGNRGAEAMLSTTIGTVRRARPDCEFVVFSYYPTADKRLVCDDRVRVYSATPAAVVGHFVWALPLWLLAVFGLKKAALKLAPQGLRELADSAVLVDLAGVSFIDYRLKFLPYNILTLWPAMLLGVPVMKLSQAIGPARRPLNRLLARFTLSRCRRVYARGGQTTVHLEEIGLGPELVRDAADLAFLYEAGFSLTQENPPEQAALLGSLASLRESGKTVIGVCPSAVLAAREGASYNDFLQALLGELLQRGYALVLYPNATRAGETSLRNNDLLVIDRLTKALGQPDALLAVSWDLNTSGIRTVIGACSVTINSRFHAMIAALAEEQPTLVIGWGHKYREVMSRFGLERYVCALAEAEAAAIADLAEELVKKRDGLSESIGETLVAVRQESRVQLEDLLDLLREASA